MHDTTREIEEMVRARYREMTPEERLRIGAEMFDTARTIMLASFPAGLSEREQRKLLAKRLYGDQFDHVYMMEPNAPDLLP